MKRRELLLRRFLAVEHVTRFYCSGWIDGDVAFVNVADYSFLIDYEGGAIAEALLLVEDAVVFHDCAFEIAKEGKRDFDLLGKFAVGGDTVYT